MWKPLFLIASLGLAGTAHATDFLAWEGTRWLLEVEETVPVPLELSAQRNLTFRTKGVQIRAVVGCHDIRLQGRKAASIGCRIEDIAFQATPRSVDEGSEEVWETSQQVLDDMVRRTQGKTLEFVLTNKGRVIRVDVPDIEANNEYERQSREVLRQLATDLASGWDLQHTNWNGTWTGTQSMVMRVPSQPQGLAASEIVHRASPLDGELVVQTIGRGTFTTAFEPWELRTGEKLVRKRTQDTSTGGGSVVAGGGQSVGGSKLGGALVDGGATPAASTPTERTFTGNLTSVAIIDKTLDAPKERVWALMGAATASSVGNNAGVSVWYNGRLRKLDADEKGDVGETQLLSPPNQPVEGLAPWVSLQD